MRKFQREPANGKLTFWNSVTFWIYLMSFAITILWKPYVAYGKTWAYHLTLFIVLQRFGQTRTGNVEFTMSFGQDNGGMQFKYVLLQKFHNSSIHLDLEPTQGGFNHCTHHHRHQQHATYTILWGKKGIPCVSHYQQYS